MSDVEPIEILKILLDNLELDEIMKPVANDFDVHKRLLHHIMLDESCHLLLNHMKTALRRSGKNDDDEWVKKQWQLLLKNSRRKKLRKEAEEEDLKEVEAAAEDRLESDMPATASARTPAVDRSISSGFHATRLAFLEASVSDLRDQLFSIHIDLWIGLGRLDFFSSLVLLSLLY
ncbi:hypothetical protein CJ030_MR6G023775 [Morella rubra]|uniref:Uncharacterized protein n=1 Tax=Morella rubra TaxID=262757 RepID=A0A6A1V9F6_9ROSI|nr:hypothetical protein CJ030_MR6G023775 [Morella rubra]